MNLMVRCSAATFFAGTLSAAAALADDAPYYVTILAARGTLDVNGVSEGAFTSSNILFSFQGVSLNGNYSGTVASLNSILGSATAVAGVETYLTGTTSLTSNPFDLQLYLPASDGSLTPVLYDLNGSTGLSIKQSQLGGESKFNLGSTSVDPNGQQDSVTISGATGAVAGQPDSFNISMVFRSGTELISLKASGLGAESSQPIGSNFLLDENFAGITGPIVLPSSFTDGGTPGSVVIANSGNAAGGAIILTGDSTYTGGTTINTGATLQLGNGGTTGSIVGDIDDEGALVANRTGSLILASNITGAGSLTQAGAGTVILAGTDSYTGGTTIDAGATLQIGNGGTTGSIVGDITDNGSLVANRSDATTYSGTISGTGSLTQSGTGTLTLTAANSYSGTTTIGTGSTLALTGAGAIAASLGVQDNGVFDISAASGAASIQSLSGTGSTILGSNTLTLTNASGTYAGTISGQGGLTLTKGSEILSNANSYTGATAIAAGSTLALTGVGAVAASSGVQNNGAFDISAASGAASIQSLSGNGSTILGANTLTLTNASGTYAGTISGQGGLTLAQGSETLSNGNSYSGATAIAAGSTLALTGAGAVAASSGVQDNGAFDISGAAGTTSIQSLSGNGSTILGANTLTLTNASGTYSGTLSGQGGFTLAQGSEILSGSNSYSGATTIVTGSTLALTGAGAISASSGVQNNGAFDISAASGNTSIQNLSGNGSTILGANTLTLTNASGTYAGTISGQGGLTLVKGSETLSNGNRYAGATTIATGSTLALTGAGAVAASSGVNNNGTFDISGAGGAASIQSLSGNGSTILGANTLTLTNASGTYAGTISGQGGFTLAQGSETLSNGNSYSGATAIAAGSTLALTGAGAIGASSSVQNNGAFDISAASGATSIQSLSGNGSTSLGANTLILTNASGSYAGTISGQGGFTLAKGSETLSNSNSYSGATTIGADSTLALTGAGAIAASSGVNNNGVFDISGAGGAASIQSLSGNGSTILGANTLTLTNASGTYAGTISGQGGFTLAQGSETLSNGNSYSGATAIAAGSTLALTGVGAVAASSGVQNNGAFDISAASGAASIQSLSGNGSTILGANTLTLTNASGTYAGTISGQGGFTLAQGSETLSNGNSYSGATAIAAGSTLALTGAGAVAASSGVQNNGTFDISAASGAASIQSLSGNGSTILGANTLTLTNASGTYAGTISGQGGLTLAQGSETLSNGNSYSGATATAAGSTLALTGAGAISASSGVQNNGAFDISAASGNTSIQNLSGNGSTILGANTLTLTNASGTYAGTISGQGGLTLAKGSEILSGSNGYSGATTIGTGSTLALTGAGAIAASSGVQNNGVFDISGASGTASIQSLSGNGSTILGVSTLTLTNASGTYSGMISGQGGLTLAKGSETLSNSNSYSGATTIGTGSTLALTGAGAVAASSGVQNNGVFDISAASGAASIQSLSGTGSTILGANTLTLTNASGTYSGTLSGQGGFALVKGSETLSNGNSYAGATTIATGSTLGLTGAGAIAASSGVTNNGVFDISSASGTTSIQSLAGNGSTILGSNKLTLTNAFGTYSGTISGQGGLAIAGGTETLSGANTYSGGTVISAGTLQGNTTSLQNDIANDGTLVFAQAADGIYSGSISGGGTLIKQGVGTVIFDGNNSAFSGTTNVTTGSLVIGDAAHTGASLGGNVSVMAAATLRGHGTILGSVTNAGSVSPGGTIGTLAIGGDYNQASTGTLDIEISPTGSSQLVVAGKADLAGHLQLNLDSGNYVRGTTYAILTAGNGVQGAFANVTQDGQNLIFRTLTAGGDVELFLASTGLLEPNAQSINGRGLAHVLDAANLAVSPADPFNMVLDAVAKLPPNRQERGFEVLGGEIYADLDGVIRDGMRAFASDVAHQLRTGSVTAGDPNTGAAVWGHAVGRFFSLDAANGANGTFDSSAGFVAGYQTAWADDATLGVAVQYDHNLISTNDLPQKANLDNFRIAGYGEQRWGAIFGDAILGASYGHGDVGRTLGASGLAGQASGSIDGFDLGGTVIAGYRLESGRYAVEPYIRLTYQFGQQSAIDETSASPAALHIGGKDRSSLQSTLGMRSSTSYALGAGTLTPEIQIAWAHEMVPIPAHLQESFEAFPQQFTVSGISSDRDAAYVDVRLDYATSGATDVYVAYSGLRGERTTSNAISAGVSTHF